MMIRSASNLYICFETIAYGNCFVRFTADSVACLQENARIRFFFAPAQDFFPADKNMTGRESAVKRCRRFVTLHLVMSVRYDACCNFATVQMLQDASHFRKEIKRVQTNTIEGILQGWSKGRDS